ncbi:MAG: universal stress protein [Pseudomonadota bacterium]
MYRSILLPVDLEAATGKRRALNVAVDLAAHWQAKLHVMTVVPDFGMSIVGSFFDDGFADRVAADVVGKLEAFVDEHVPAGLAVTREVARGSIYDGVLRAAVQRSCDCIVIGSHRPALQDYLLGPNAARVVRHAKCSVVVVRP